MNELYHHGVKGMKWGVRRTKEQLGYSDSSPKIKTKNGDYIYKKGTVIGRFGAQKIDDNIMFAYTNKKDRSYYSNRFGGEEQIMICKKDIKMPSLSKQFLELYKYTGDKQWINNPYEYWKDHINVIGPMADGYFNYMKKQGYDAVIDFRNYGLTEDPIMILNPKQCLQNRKDILKHSAFPSYDFYIVKGKKYLDRYL